MKRDAGMTLIEVLIAVVILGLGVVVLLTGILTASSGSGSARNSADSRALLAAAAEALEAADYRGCADPASADPTKGYTGVLAAVARPGQGPDTTGSTDEVTLLEVHLWNGGEFVARTDADACDYDKGTGASRMQRLLLRHDSDRLTYVKAAR